MTQTIQRRVSTPPADSPLPRAKSNLNQHLAYRFAQETGKRTMVVGHRGGFLGPENSLKGFQAAIDAGLEAIEFDVSISIFVISSVINIFEYCIGMDEQRQWIGCPPRWGWRRTQPLWSEQRVYLQLDQRVAFDKDRHWRRTVHSYSPVSNWPLSKLS